MEGPWTILELTELAADALAAGRGSGSVRANGRGRDVPNERLVRWYVTVGLVDPPLSRRGRVAQYGRRHLLQLVAVKRRQAERRSLAEIQAELSGATDETLAAIAHLPEDLAAFAHVPEAQGTPEASGPARDRFWARPASRREADTAERAEEGGASVTGRQVRAMRVAGAGRGDGGRADGGRADGGQADGERPDGERGRAEGEVSGTGGIVHGVRLAPGVTLLLEGGGRGPGPEDVTAIVNAARALLAELASRNLREPGSERLAGAPGPPEVGPLTEESQT
jgi:hypothetical protein